MFLGLLAAVLAGAAVHIAVAPGPGGRSASGAAERVLVWVLAGYCGFPMLVMSVAILERPEQTAAWLGLPPGGPIQAFMGVAYLSLAVIASLTPWYRGGFVLAAGLAWITYFAGATWVHLGPAAGGGASHGDALMVLATHGLVSLILAAAILVRGRGEGAREGQRALGRA